MEPFIEAVGSPPVRYFEGGGAKYLSAAQSHTRPRAPGRGASCGHLSLVPGAVEAPLGKMISRSCLNKLGKFSHASPLEYGPCLGKKAVLTPARKPFYCT